MNLDESCISRKSKNEPFPVIGGVRTAENELSRIPENVHGRPEEGISRDRRLQAARTARRSRPPRALTPPHASTATLLREPHSFWGCDRKSMHLGSAFSNGLLNTLIIFHRNIAIHRHSHQCPCFKIPKSVNFDALLQNLLRSVEFGERAVKSPNVVLCKF